MMTQTIEANGQLTRQIIGCCFRAHRALGPGFPERVYQAALVECLADAGLAFERERRFVVHFEEVPVGEFFADLVVEQRVILEVKAVTGPMPRVFAAQVLAYLKAAQLPIGLLVNFGNVSCEVKRLSFSSEKSSFKNLRNQSSRKDAHQPVA